LYLFDKVLLLTNQNTVPKAVEEALSFHEEQWPVQKIPLVRSGAPGWTTWQRGISDGAPEVRETLQNGNEWVTVRVGFASPSSERCILFSVPRAKQCKNEDGGQSLLPW
jgi:hypothetical protein